MKRNYHSCCFILLTIILFLTTGFSQQAWDPQPLPSPNTGLFGIHVLNSQNIWAVGDSGLIIHSSDGGTSWSEITCPVNYSLFNVHFINADTGWVGGDHPTITEVLRTTDRGLSWETQILYTPSDEGNNDIEFMKGGAGEPPRGFVTAGLSHVWRTDDYGVNWVQSPIGGCGSGDLESICFIDKDEGWFVGTPAANLNISIVHTSDGGQTFDIQTNPTDPDIKLNGVCFADNQHGVAVGLDGTILYTGDGGQNWEIRPSPASGYHRWQSVYMTETGKAWAVGNAGNIAYSADWGYTWTAQQSGVSCELWEVYFINETEGWIVGGGIGHPGVILHTTTGGLTDIKEPTMNTPEEFSLFQNYPNPFNPVTMINYQLPITSNVQLKVHNILGREIITLIDERKPAGQHQVEWNAANLPSGLYFYSLQAGNYHDVKKMILMK